MVAVMMNEKNANQLATFRKFFLLIRQIPWSSSGGRSCFAFRNWAPTGGAGLAVAGGGGDAGAIAGASGVAGVDFGFTYSVVAAGVEDATGRAGDPDTGFGPDLSGGKGACALPDTGVDDFSGGSAGRATVVVGCCSSESRASFFSLSFAMKIP